MAIREELDEPDTGIEESLSRKEKMEGAFQRASSSEQDALEQMEEDGQEVAVESASVHVEFGSHPMRLLHVSLTSGE